MTDRTRVLVADNEPGLRRALGVSLGARGYDVRVAVSARDALAVFADHVADIVVFDLAVSDMGGAGAVRAMRARTVAPIIVLSWGGNVRGVADALRAGVDGYIRKSFGVGLLLERLTATLRDAAERVVAVRTSDLTIDVAAKRIETARGRVSLTAAEWQMVALLVRNRGSLVTAHRLVDEAGGPMPRGSGPARCHMAELRRKLEPDPARPRYLIAEPGVGYRFAAE